MKQNSKRNIKEEKPNKSGAEKPVSLWGAPFTDVLAALLKTKPMPKEENIFKKDTKNNER